MLAPSCSTGRLSRAYSFLYVYNYVSDERYSYFFIPKQDTNQYYSGEMYSADYCFTHEQHPSESYSYFVGDCKKGNGFYSSNIYYYNQIIFFY